MLPIIGGTSMIEKPTSVHTSLIPKRNSDKKGLGIISGIDIGRRMPNAPVLPVVILLATGFGTYLISCAISRMR
jgi:hypothetical protein